MMKHLRDAMAEANRVIDRALEQFKRPAVLWSGGKDSMVLLYMLRARNLKLDVVSLTEPWQPARYRWVRRIAEDWNLAIYDAWPAGITLQKGAGRIEYVNHYRLSATKTLALPHNLYEPARMDKGLCLILDVLRRPCDPNLVLPWDCYLHGHKSCDVDPLLGPVPIDVDMVIEPSQPALVFPLRQWSDGQIWEYSRSYQVPQDPVRYDVDAGAERETHEENPDWMPCCTRCVDPDGPAAVQCPKLDTMIPNQAQRVPWTPAIRPDYFKPRERENDAVQTECS